jgi:hypothetical protein
MTLITASAASQPRTNPGPSSRARGDISINTTATMGMGLRRMVYLSARITPGGWCRVAGRGWMLATVNPGDRLRSVGRRMTDPAEVLAQQITERVVELVVNALDVNDLVARVDLNAVLGGVDIDAVLKKVELNALLDRVDLNPLLDRVDVDALLKRADVDEVIRRVDVGAVLDRVDVNDLVKRIDMAALVEETDLGAVIARSSGGAVSEALDALRSQVVGLDQLIDRWVSRLLRRKHPRPSAPAALLRPQTEP